MASAVLNTSQQIGGSLGTALLNTLFAGAVTSYLADNAGQPAGRRRWPTRSSTATGWRSSGARCCSPLALVAALVLINAKKDDIPADAAGAAVAAPA